MSTQKIFTVLQRLLNSIAHSSAKQCNDILAQHCACHGAFLFAGLLSVLIVPIHVIIIGALTGSTLVVVTWLFLQLPLALFLAKTGNLFFAKVFYITLTTVALGASYWVSNGSLEGAVAIILLFSLLGWFRSDLQRHMAEHVDQEQINKSKIIARSISGAIYLHEDDGNSYEVSANLSRLLHAHGLEFDREGYRKRIHSSDVAAYDAAFKRVHKTGETQLLELRLAKGPPSESSFLEYEWFAIALKSGGELNGTKGSKQIVACLQNCDKVKNRSSAIEAELRKLTEENRNRLQLLANASHELKAPLNAVMGFAELLQNTNQYCIDEETSQKYLGLIRQSSSHMLAVIRDNLDIARLDTGNYPFEINKFDLKVCLDSCLTLIEHEARTQGIDVMIDTDPKLGAITADEKACKQILLNVLSNSLKYTEDGGEIRLVASRAPDHVAIEIYDNGIGIDIADMPRLCEPFFQARNAKMKNKQGSGLGLSVVKGLTERQGGQLRITSQIGVGTTVKIKLPSTSHFQEVDEKSVSTDFQTSKRNVA